jgi:hypothetical protein
MNKQIILFVAIVIFGFAVVNETLVVVAQSNSNSDKQKIIVTWLETNDTKTSSDTPVISISGEDFWKTFEPLLKQSINGP